MLLTQLAQVAHRTGYPVEEVPGWKTRTRPGGMVDIHTITCHHTANGGAAGNYPSLRTVRDGRPGLAGPLAHYGIGLDGTIYVIGAGRCNHAGESLKVEYGNAYAIGIEAEAVGTANAHGDWPPKQMESYARLCRALIQEFGLRTKDVRGHKETCRPVGRKSDPSFDMDAFRDKVAACDLSTPPKELSEMDTKDWIRLEKLIDERVDAIVTRILTRDPLVTNRVTKAAKAADPLAKPSKASVVWALGNIEGDQDDDRPLLEGSTPAPPPA